VQRVIDAITTAPAWVRNHRGDVLAANELGQALYLHMMAEGATPLNSARFTFLEPESAGTLQRLGTQSGRRRSCPALRSRKDPYDKDLTDLIG
jgi:hypothetical protein